MAACQARLEQALDNWLPAATTHPARLHEAMRYAVMDGGKRIRPTLVYAGGMATGAVQSRLDAPACAVELIHAYSLVHDDLPAMDDDDLRRGKPSCHRAFGEATAVLAGDALQSLAFQVLAQDGPETTAAARLDMIRRLALASGSRGMAGGQAIDLAATGQQLNIAELEDMHIHKTGALIRASVVLGALCGNNDVDSAQLGHLDHYAKCIGLAFQIRDDILDVEGETETLGKHTGMDQHREKSTYPALIGLDAARQRARELHMDAMDSITGFDERADPLRWISAYIIDRER